TLLELNENDRSFQCSTATCTFVTDSGEFVNENKHETNKCLNVNQLSNYRFILPHPPLQQLCINYMSKKL
ncbi:10942_t:CDS:2, partial [Funneliformis mosseae]